MSQWLPGPPEAVFAFFSDAHNLEGITPRTLRFHVLTPQPIVIQAGTLIDYRLKVRGVPLRWTTHIAKWDPPHSFQDEQLRGPYRRWVHTHSFRPENGGTWCDDHVQYTPPGGPLAPLINRLFIQRDVEQIFAYRAKVLEEIFGSQ